MFASRLGEGDFPRNGKFLSRADCLGGAAEDLSIPIGVNFPEVKVSEQIRIDSQQIPSKGYITWLPY